MTYSNEQRAVCDDGFDDMDAGVACIELFGSPEVLSYSIGH
jgi:hypothetical protein